MSDSIKPWHKVFVGDDECRFFKALARHPEFPWRSTGALAKAAKLSDAEVEEIAQRYVTSGQVVQHSDGGKWAYFERVKAADKKDSIGNENKKKRVADVVAAPKP